MTNDVISREMMIRDSRVELDALGVANGRSFVDPAAWDRAIVKFRSDLGTFSEFLIADEASSAALLAHALITPALILGHPTLADACRVFETEVRDGRNADTCELFALVKLTLAALHSKTGIDDPGLDASGGPR